jgi:hypothetical protein
MKRWFSLKRSTQVLTAVIALGVGLGVGGAVLAASPSQPTKGPLPADITKPGSEATNTAAIPDYISTVDKQGNFVGYVAKSDLYPSGSGAAPAAALGPVPVYGPDLKTVVGHMYPGGVGYVPLGSQPPAGVTTTTTTIAPGSGG